MQITETIIGNFKINSHLLPKIIDGIQAADLHQSIHGNTNALIWLAGHIFHYRLSAANMIDCGVQNPYQDLFKAPYSQTNNYPSMQELLAKWGNLSQQFLKALSKITKEQLDKPAPFQTPNGNQDLGGTIVFMEYHETYHMGQMAFLRKALGYEWDVIKAF